MLIQDQQMMAQHAPDNPGAPGSGNMKIKFTNPNIDNYEGNIKYAAQLHKEKHIQMASRDSLKGRNAIVCGSGPSLKDPKVLKRIKRKLNKGYLLFACKGAIKFLYEKGIKVDYGVTMDPGAHIARPDRKIYRAPGTTHILASSSDKLLFDYMLSELPYGEWLNSLTEEEQKRVLMADFDKWKNDGFRPDVSKGKQLVEDHPAKVLIFHSATGLKNELNLYKTLFSDGSCMGGGYNVVNRAISIARYMGIDHITLAGVDSGWRMNDDFYVDGPAMMDGVNMCDNGKIELTPQEQNEYANMLQIIDSEEKLNQLPQKVRERYRVLNSKVWMTRPDMLASAVAMAKMIKKEPDRYDVIGDAMPAFLVKKDDEFLARVANFNG